MQDLSHLEHTLSSSLPPRFAALNMAIISLIEDYSLVGFETLAVEDKASMLNLTRTIDRATGYIFIPDANSSAPPGTIDEPANAAPTVRPNTYALFSSAAGPLKGPGSDVRDVQERWIDAKDDYDAFERREWRKEGEAVRDEVARREAAQKQKTNNQDVPTPVPKIRIRERKGPDKGGDHQMDLSEG